jgi:hypothetical protein
VGTLCFFGTETFAWDGSLEFDGTLELQLQTAKHSNVLEMAGDAFQAAAGLLNECGALRNCGCDDSDERRQSDCDSYSCRHYPRVFSGRSIDKYQVENVAADSRQWRLLHGGLCGNKDLAADYAATKI